MELGAEGGRGHILRPKPLRSRRHKTGQRQGARRRPAAELAPHRAPAHREERHASPAGRLWQDVSLSESLIRLSDGGFVWGLCEGYEENKVHVQCAIS